MRILSFDTSTPNLYACLAEDQTIQIEQTIICNPLDRQFAASLIMPTLSTLLEKAHWQKKDIEAIAVGTGPGSFTGARIAVVTARTLCQALNLPLLGINRFQCYAFTERVRNFPSAMILEAGKKQYFCAHIHNDICDFDSASAMNTVHLSEDQLLNCVRDFKYVYMEKSATIARETSELIANNWHLMPDLINPAITQVQIASQTLQFYRQPTDLAKFNYKQIKPLYIQGASITIKSAKQSVN